MRSSQAFDASMAAAPYKMKREEARTRYWFDKNMEKQ
jgi:hypothetical protein